MSNSPDAESPRPGSSAPTAAVGLQPPNKETQGLMHNSTSPHFTMDQVLSLMSSLTKEATASAVAAAFSSCQPHRKMNDFYLPPFDPDERSHDIRDWCAHVDDTIKELKITQHEARMKAILQLRGRAKTWADMWSLHSTSWDEIKEDLIKHFGSEFRYADDVLKWRNYTSDHASSYAEYATTAWTLFKRIRPEAADSEVVEAIITGKKWASKTREQEAWRMMPPVAQQRRQQSVQCKNKAPPGDAAAEERPVVELFNKSRDSASPLPTRPSTYADQVTKKVRETQRYEDETTGNLEQVSTEALKKNKEARHPHKVKYRSRRYEMPTVASQMKQAGVRYYYGTGNHSNIPFIVSKSTAPSHNIGVNIQQVLNGLKIQQPLSGIPPTIAHHMGLGHIPTHGTKSAIAHPPLEQREINAIKLGRRLVRLPSYKYISYNRMLNLYREGDGMVPRFLRAISRPHYFYTSMYNLATNREDLDGATSKGNVRSQAAKQSLAEYTSLYREYEQLEKCLKEGNYEPEWERRRDELSRELAAREEHIRRVVQDYRTSSEAEPAVLRASASNAEDGYRRVSSFKLNLDPQQ